MTACRPRCPVGQCGACDAERTRQAEYRRVQRTLVEVFTPRPDREWHDLGLCREVDPDLWFPERGGSTRDAKRICRRCPVQEKCLQQALDAGERFGVWGGVSERERRQMDRERAA
ncbi:putative WhiB family transcriptional regulator [Tsukamurella phage TPA4]|uniref:WhiB transcriptional factor n=1 Tax=Tsukamurella phage TPA4 TaxID=1647476 RepID=UPI0007B62A4D|nr:WhiB transcriptional factor [Tsukamurella phage TPA4]AKJ72237.1 putative WhiB family transcriptional regulator [Tsukamurella phage TPA4]